LTQTTRDKGAAFLSVERNSAMSSPKTVVVHSFKHYDGRINESKEPKSKRTAEQIKRLGLEIVPGTEETVAASDLDDDGRYYPKAKGGS
jgi:hypothetical protein